MPIPTGPAPLEPQRMSTAELFDRIHRKLNELEHMVQELDARVDTAFPGADLNRHRVDHDEIHEREQDRKLMMRSLRDKSLGGVVMAIGAFVFAAIVAAIVNYLRTAK